ncbi:MAG: cation-translocating P-type ATPase [Lentisphaerae bacterium]|nr:cation-translocating P-type ATPase [Lentisphaerota bacterium]
MRWHTATAEEALGALETSAGGLSSGAARERRARHGPNVLQEKRRAGVVSIAVGQFTDFMILVLIAAAIVSGFIGEPGDTIAILVIVLLNAVIGFVQEYRAEKAMEALQKLAAPRAVALRDGSAVQLDAADLVPGDVVILEAGAFVPADLRLLEAAQLRVDESAITGESVPVHKQTAPLGDADLPLGDRLNMLYRGTVTVHGRARAVVTATGMDTELGRIAGLLQGEKETRTPLQKRLAVFGRRLAVGVLALCAVIFGVGVLRGEPVMLMLLTAISLAVAAIPEALPAVVTISLALGARKMVRRSALIRRLPAVETLGSVTYICSDKTGTLTHNRMTVEHLYAGDNAYEPGALAAVGDGDGAALRHFLQALAVSNDAARAADGSLLGDPTETALVDAAARAGYEKAAIEAVLPRAGELPFESERKRMTTLHRAPDGTYVSYTKGAADEILKRCRGQWINGAEQPLDAAAVAARNDALAGKGLRVLAFAMRTWEAEPDALEPDRVEQDMLFLGLAGMIDPPRDEAAEAVAQCRAAGIRPVMITGDHPKTARAVALRIGILEEDGEVISGRELAAMDDAEFAARVEHIGVYARVAPEQKLKILKGLQARGQFAAMTGDGVNDAPALKRADIGIAMGVTGTDVAKGAAHMILLDDNFATIVKAVREGRRIYDNIRKFIRYTMTSNAGEIWTLFLAPFIGLPVPLLPIHILWINLVTDGLPGLALTAEPEEKDIMTRPPRHPRESIFAHGMVRQIIWVGLLMGVVSLFTQAWSLDSGQENWQTMVFTVLCLSQIGNVLALRSDRRSLFSLGLFSNKPLLGAALLTVGLQMAVIYVPALNPVFKTAPLSAANLARVLGLSLIVFLAVEAEKALRGRIRRNRAEGAG